MAALAKRSPNGTESSTRLPERAAKIVTAHDAKERMKSGIFSLIAREKEMSEARFLSAINESRARGQKSRNNKTTGNVTTIGFAIKAQAKNAVTTRFLFASGCRV